MQTQTYKTNKHFLIVNDKKQVIFAKCLKSGQFVKHTTAQFDFNFVYFNQQSVSNKIKLNKYVQNVSFILFTLFITLSILTYSVLNDFNHTVLSVSYSILSCVCCLIIMLCGYKQYQDID